MEIDLLENKSNKLTPIEIKAAQTYTSDFSKNLKKFMSYANLNYEVILYDGDRAIAGSDGIEVMNWKSFLLR